MNARLVHEMLRDSAAAAPDQPLLIDDASYSYQHVELESDRLARLLVDRGVSSGDRVALLARNGIDYVVSYYATLKSGAISVPLNTAAEPAQLASCLEDCSPRFLVIEPSVRVKAIEAMQAIDSIEGSELLCPAELGQELVAQPSGPPPVSLKDSEPASIIYTSGSTARPRGATLTHRNLIANTASILSYLRLGAGDRVMAVLPFFYVYGKSLLNTHVAVGGSVVIENRFMFLNSALDRLEQLRCSGFAGVPSTFAILLDRSNLAERKLEHLRYVTQAGGAMSSATTKRLIQALPRQEIFVMYGATEASARLTYLEPSDLERKLGSVGRAIDGVTIKVLRPDGTSAHAGEHGEIVASGPNIMLGYWNDPEETARVLSAEGLRTGDIGYLDDEGFLYVVGRSKEMIKTGAHRVSPQEIEHSILSSGLVHEAAVIGVEDELLGEAIVAFVVLHGNEHEHPPQLARLEEHLKRTLPAYKLPQQTRVLEHLPKSGAGKIQKRLLRSLL